MKHALLSELALLFLHEADGILQPYAWPPRPPLSTEEQGEYERLRTTARAIGYRAHVAAYEEGLCAICLAPCGAGACEGCEL